MDTITYDLPLSIETGVRKKKKHYLNLNLYRNMPFHLNNNLKKATKKIVEEVCPEFRFETFELLYTLYLPDNRLRDISNVCCVIDKYQTDALTELGYIPDDNYKHLPKVTYTVGGVDTENPRCEVRVICLDT
jgi:hypothetical protein